MKGRENIADILGLSSMQEAVLYNSLRNHSADPGFLQISCTLTGALDAGHFRKACEIVTRRHTALRTSVHWEGLEAPVQMIHREVDIIWTERDLRRHEGTDRPDLDEILHADRRAGLDLTTAPANRFGLFRTGDRVWHFVWSCHHVLLDGWSGGLVIGEIVRIHDGLVRGTYEYPGPATSHAAFVRRARNRQDESALEFWRHKLHGFTAPTPLPYSNTEPHTSAGSGGEHRVSVSLSADDTEKLSRALRESRVTLGSAVQAAWAVLLAAGTESRDVLFGMTDSGRSSGQPEVESAVGLFINTMPIRTTVWPSESFSDLASRLLSLSAESREHAGVEASSIRSCADLATSGRLYESLVVVQNYPGMSTADAGEAGLSISAMTGGITSNYPLTLVALPGDELSLHLIADASRFTKDVARTLIGDMGAVLSAVSSNPHVRTDGLIPRRPRPTERAGPDTAGVRPRSTDTPYASPSDTLETQLVQIWSRILNLDTVGIDDDFFDIGGHSILVLELVSEIERALGKRIPIVTLVRRSTVRELAAALRDEGWSPPWSSIVPMQPEGNSAPLFCIHSWSGNVLMYRRLARELAPDVPVFGLQAEGVDNKSKPHATVEQMAAHYIQEMKSVRPDGPYALLGYCFSVSVAAEMARQLVSGGDRISALFIVDMPPRFDKDAGYYVERFRLYIREAGLTGMIRSKFRWWKKRARAVGGGDIAGGRMRSTLSRVERANQSAWSNYVFENVPGSIIYIESSERARQFRRTHHVERWREIVDGTVDVRTVEGRHGRLFDPPTVQKLAAEIRRTMLRGGTDRSQRGDRSISATRTLSISR